MKTKMIMLTAILIGLVSCNAQEKNKETKNAPIAENKHQQTTPKGNWKVNKEFDDKGNLISYDSIYTYSYSTENGDTIPLGNKNNIVKNFHQYFNGTEIPEDFMNQFFNDSIQPEENFFSNNFYSNRMFSKDMQKQIQQMDSLRNAFIKKYESQMWDDKQTNKNTQQKDHV